MSPVAIYTVITAIMVWDPLYAAVWYGQHRGEEVKASVTPFPGRTQAGVSHDRWNAA